MTDSRVRVYLGCSLDGCIAGPEHAGLVDEPCLSFLPVILGQGIRLWDGLQNRTDLVFEPPTTHGGSMVQVTARRR